MNDKDLNYFMEQVQLAVELKEFEVLESILNGIYNKGKLDQKYGEI